MRLWTTNFPYHFHKHLVVSTKHHNPSPNGVQMHLLLTRPKPLLSRLILTHGAPHPTRPAEAIGSGPGTRLQQQLPPRRPLLPMPRPLHPPPHCRLHRPLRQVPPLLPRTHSLTPFLSLPLLNPNTRFSSSSSSSSSSSDDSDSDPYPQPAKDMDGSDSDESDPDPQHAKDLDRVCKLIDSLFSPSDRNMEAVLDDAGVDLDRHLVIAVLDRFQHAHRPAHRFFRWAGSRPGFSHDSVTCAKMLGVLGKCRQFETVVDFLEEMGKEGNLSLDAFKVAIRAFASAREMKKAVGMFKLMKRFDFEAGIDTFNLLIDALAKAKLVKEGNELVEKMRDQYAPDLRTYSLLLFGWCKIKNLVEAGRIWNEMLDKGLKPDVVAHNTMLDGLIRGQRRPEAIKFFELMKAKGPYPNARTYTILIQDLCKAGKMDRAVACFEEMVSAGCAPEVATYTCLIVGYGNARQMDRVSVLLQEMREKGCPPDGRTYNALIKLMTNRNMPDDAARIYKKMIKNGFEPTIHTYNMMMKSYFHGKNYEMGCATWEEMGRKGICPDVNSYTVFIGGHIRHGRAEEAGRYLEEMINKGMKAPQIDYNKFAADFSKAGRPDALYELAQKMKFSGKFEASNVLNGWAEKMKRRVKWRGTKQTGERLF